MLEDKKEVIFACAKALFAAKGFKDTSVAEITQKAGMAVGTFYLYYPSKEKLFLELLLVENEKLKREMLASLDMSQSPQAVIRQVLAFNLNGMRQNPILKQWYDTGAFEKIEKTYRDDNGVESVHFLYYAFVPIVEQWQATGQMRRDMDSKTIMAMFAALVSIDTHKAEIGLEYFPGLLETMTEYVVKGLTDMHA